MNNAEIAGIFIAGMMVLIALRVPLGAAMFIAGAAGYWWMVGDAVLLGGESATLRMLLGGALVLAAMLIVELVPHRRIEAEVPHIAA